MEKFAAAGAHGECANLGEFFEEGADFGLELRIAGGEVGESLHGEGFYDAAFIAQVVEENFDDDGAFDGGEFQAREDLGGVPPDFLLVGAVGHGQEFLFEALQEIGSLGGDFFDGVGGAHAKDFIIGGQGGDELGEDTGIIQDFDDDFVGLAKRAASAAGKFFDNGMHDCETRPKLYRGVSHLRRRPILLSIFPGPNVPG